MEIDVEGARKQMRKAYEEMQKFAGGPPIFTINLSPDGPEIISNMPRAAIIMVMNCTMLGLASDSIKIIHPN